MKMLIEGGAELNARDIADFTPLMYAKRIIKSDTEFTEILEVIKALLNAG